MSDAFATADLRAAVIRSWTDLPYRFREDANAEEDYAHGYYRDRLIVELAQNAADAAARAGVPGVLRLRLDTDGPARLIAANTGAPLDDAGVRSLASLRASAKTDSSDATTGQFGVGFAAVRSMADEIVVASRTGAVRFSLARAGEALSQAAAGHPQLLAELADRGDRLPVLRLPFADDARPQDGADTEVVLLLRDDDAVRAVRRQLAEVDDTLALALPGLHRIEVSGDELTDDQSAGSDRTGPRVIEHVETRWHTLQRSGRFSPQAVADLPVEQRGRDRWRLTWAVPRDDRSWPPVVHAPTPTDEPLDLPALLLGTFPVDPARRHLAESRATDELLTAAADAYTDLAIERPGWGLVPTGLPRGRIDATLRALLEPRLRAAPFLPTIGGEPVAPRHALALPPDLATVNAVSGGRDDGGRAGSGTLVGPGGRAGPSELTGPDELTEPGGRAGPGGLAGLAGELFAGVVTVPDGRWDVARALDVEVLDLDRIVEAVADRPGDLGTVYDAFESVSTGAHRESLSRLPIRLADGRTVRGAAGVVDVDGAHDRAALGRLARHGVRLLDPTTRHPLLEILGLRTLPLAELLAEPSVRAAVMAWVDEELDGAGPPEPGDESLGEPDATAWWPEAPAEDRRLLAVTGTVLALLADVADGPEWLAELPLIDTDGELGPAGGMVLGGSFAARVLGEDVPEVDPSLRAATSDSALTALGVLTDLAVRELPEVIVAAEEPADDSPPQWADYLDELADRWGDTLVVGTQQMIADLDAVRTDRWVEVLGHLRTSPEHRRAVVDPVIADLDGRPVRVRGYTSWWLGRRFSADDIVVATGAAPGLRWLAGRLGLPTTDDLGPDGSSGTDPQQPEVIRTQADPDFERAIGLVTTLADLDDARWRTLLAVAADGLGGSDPADIAATIELHRALADAAVAGRVDRVDRLPAFRNGTHVVTSTADDVVVVDSAMRWQAAGANAVVLAPGPERAEAVADLLDADLLDPVVTADAGEPVPVPTAVTLLIPTMPAEWIAHEELRADGIDIDWWVDGDGPSAAVRARTVDGAARGLAVAAGRWELRATIAGMLAEVEPSDVFETGSVD